MWPARLRYSRPASSWAGETRRASTTYSPRPSSSSRTACWAATWRSRPGAMASARSTSASSTIPPCSSSTVSARMCRLLTSGTSRAVPGTPQLHHHRLRTSRVWMAPGKGTPRSRPRGTIGFGHSLLSKTSPFPSSCRTVRA
eukprot:jgi/Mesvir1/2725/Mv26370-RA.1